MDNTDRSVIEDRAAHSRRLLERSGFAFDVSGLSRALQSDDLAYRSEAAFLLGVLHDPAASGVLQTALHDSSARVRVEAAHALARLGDTKAATPVLQAELKGQFFQDAPLRAAQALAQLGDPQGYPRVLEALDSPLPSNRREAVATLPRFAQFNGQTIAGKPIDTVGALLNAAKDAEPILRRDALQQLMQSSDPRAKAARETALHDSDQTVRDLDKLASGPTAQTSSDTPEG